MASRKPVQMGGWGPHSALEMLAQKYPPIAANEWEDEDTGPVTPFNTDELGPRPRMVTCKVELPEYQMIRLLAVVDAANRNVGGWFELKAIADKLREALKEVR
jgi:hypothetical protein